MPVIQDSIHKMVSPLLKLPWSPSFYLVCKAKIKHFWCLSGPLPQDHKLDRPSLWECSDIRTEQFQNLSNCVFF